MIVSMLVQTLVRLIPIMRGIGVDLEGTLGLTAGSVARSMTSLMREWPATRCPADIKINPSCASSSISVSIAGCLSAGFLPRIRHLKSKPPPPLTPPYSAPSKPRSSPAMPWPPVHRRGWYPASRQPAPLHSPRRLWPGRSWWGPALRGLLRGGRSRRRWHGCIARGWRGVAGRCWFAGYRRRDGR